MEVGYIFMKSKELQLRDLQYIISFYTNVIIYIDNELVLSRAWLNHGRMYDDYYIDTMFVSDNSLHIKLTLIPDSAFYDKEVLL